MVRHKYCHMRISECQTLPVMVWFMGDDRRWCDVATKSKFTCFNVKRAVYLKSLPSRLYSGCGLSRTIKTMSAGIFPRVWSPSFGNVTFVPDFQPGLIAILTSLSSFFGEPSACSTRREIFIFLTQPLLISSSVAYKSCSIAGSCVFSFFSGVWTLNECDLLLWKIETKHYPDDSSDIESFGIYLKAPPSPFLEPKPPNGEKKSVSVSRSKTFLSNILSDMSKNEANGLLEPKNCANVALGSPWNWYVKLFVPLPFVVPGKYKFFYQLLNS